MYYRGLSFLLNAVYADREKKVQQVIGKSGCFVDSEIGFWMDFAGIKWGKFGGFNLLLGNVINGPRIHFGEFAYLNFI